MSSVLLTSGSVPALAAALDLAEVGIKVWIADVSPQLPREPVRDPDGEIATFLAELAEPIAQGGSPAPEANGVVTHPSPVLLRSKDGEWKPQPTPAPWGIPTVPLSHECILLRVARRGLSSPQSRWLDLTVTY